MNYELITAFFQKKMKKNKVGCNILVKLLHLIHENN